MVNLGTTNNRASFVTVETETNTLFSFPLEFFTTLDKLRGNLLALEWYSLFNTNLLNFELVLLDRNLYS
jgi:hypothetical protein